MPVLPGKLDELRAFGRELMGARRSEFDEYQKRGGVTRQTVSIQELPNGRVQAIVWLEGEDREVGAEPVQESSEFAVWFRERVQEITGVDLAGPATRDPELVLDWKA
jgi:hypothetical protein